jgi:arylformamidase
MIYDISIPLGERTPEWPGDTPFSCGWTARIAAGASVNVSTITTSPHAGTHADAPLHVRDDWPPSDELPLDIYMGPAVVCTVPGHLDVVGIEHLSGLERQPAIERLLLRTRRGVVAGRFPEMWPVLSDDALNELLGRGLRLLGVDAPSIDRRTSKTLDIHRQLFGGGAYNLENLDLRVVPDGTYELIALPLRLEGLDAAPVRAVLRARAPGH